MSLEAIEKVTVAEENARKCKAEAMEQARRSTLEAEREGKELMASSAAKAEQQAKTLLQQAEEQAEKRIDALKEENARDCAALRKAAEAKLDEAARLIVEKVVNG